MVALLAVMTIMALFALAAAPSILQQAQREREQETIFRGEEMADAIRLYYVAQKQNKGIAGDPALPTSVDDLLEGVTRRGMTKKLQVLRPSAASDPLFNTGEWQLIRPRSSRLSDFQQSLILYAGNVQPSTNDPQLKADERVLAATVVLVTGLTPSSSAAGEDDAGSTSGPFIGVASRNKQKAVINYYGIDEHDQWIFTPLFR
jgi:type II secretory pathway pseudopilin PulG